MGHLLKRACAGLVVALAVSACAASWPPIDPAACQTLFYSSDDESMALELDESRATLYDTFHGQRARPVGDPFDNCPLLANGSQTDTDGDLIGDVCDLLPYDRDHEKAQCFVDLGDANQALVQAQADLAVSQAQRVFQDVDSDASRIRTTYAPRPRGSTPSTA